MAEAQKGLFRQPAVGGDEAIAYVASDGATMYHRAYHGSPHDFDKFDLSKIGTGE